MHAKCQIENVTHKIPVPAAAAAAVGSEAIVSSAGFKLCPFTTALSLSLVFFAPRAQTEGCTVLLFTTPTKIQHTT